MTVHTDIERSIAMAEAARGNYLLFATESEDDKAQQVFEDMAQDMDRHVKILESRRDYLEEHNQLNGGAKHAGGQNGHQNQKQGKQSKQNQQGQQDDQQQ